VQPPRGLLLAGRSMMRENAFNADEMQQSQSPRSRRSRNPVLVAESPRTPHMSLLGTAAESPLISVVDVLDSEQVMFSESTVESTEDTTCVEENKSGFQTGRGTVEIGGNTKLAATHFFEEGYLVLPYKLPQSPKHIYRHQTQQLTRTKPEHVVCDAVKWLQREVLAESPFERVLNKIPETTRPDLEGPAGPMAHPNEPVWFEMGHQLKTIFARHSRRVERRRKRRQARSKLFGRRARRRDEGRALRQYLDDYFATNVPSVVGETSETLESVPEQPSCTNCVQVLKVV